MGVVREDKAAGSRDNGANRTTENTAGSTGRPAMLGHPLRTAAASHESATSIAVGDSALVAGQGSPSNAIHGSST